MDARLSSKYGDQLMCTDIEIKLDSQSGRYQLPNSDILRRKKIVGMFLRYNSAGNKRTPLTNRPLAGDLVINNSYLSLQSDNNDFLENFPLEMAAITAQDRSIIYMEVRGFNPTKSYVEIPNPGTNVTQGESILIHFFYVNEESPYSDGSGLL